MPQQVRQGVALASPCEDDLAPAGLVSHAHAWHYRFPMSSTVLNSRLAIVLALASISACKKKSEDSGGSTSTGKTTNQAKPADSGPFGEWDMAARKAAFQG